MKKIHFSLLITGHCSHIMDNEKPNIESNNLIIKEVVFSMMKGRASFQIGHIETFKSGTTHAAITFTSSHNCASSDFNVVPLSLI